MWLWKSDGNLSLPSCGHTCTDFGIPIAGDVEGKEELVHCPFMS